MEELQKLTKSINKMKLPDNLKLIELNYKEIKNTSSYGGIGGPQNCEFTTYTYELNGDFFYNNSNITIDFSPIDRSIILSYINDKGFKKYLKNRIKLHLQEIELLKSKY